MQILQEQKSALPPTPAKRATEPSNNRDVFYDQILSIGRLINRKTSPRSTSFSFSCLTTPFLSHSMPVKHYWLYVKLNGLIVVRHYSVRPEQSKRPSVAWRYQETVAV